MEYEVRFYYSKEQISTLVSLLENCHDLKKHPRTYEKTIQFNHSDPNYDFYSKKVDGRFRFRVSSNELERKCKLSWKQRIPTTTTTAVNKEIEKEVAITYEDADNFIYIVTKVMHFKLVESYERYRTIFENKEIEISIDEYPFGVALEIESKGKSKNPEETVMYWVNKLGLNINDTYRMSWDDKYSELCQQQNVPIYNEVTFDKKMPVVK